MTVIGANGEGESSRPRIYVVSDPENVSSDITLSVLNNPVHDPFFKDRDELAAKGITYEYHFKPIPLVIDGVEETTVETTNSEGGGVLKFYHYSSGIEFWIESTGPLPARSENEIKITGNAGGSVQTREVSVFLNTRAFDPEYREF